MQSSIANSSATRIGGLYSAIELPSTKSAASRGAPRERRGDEVGRGHQAVAVLVVLVDADAVEAERVGVFELVHDRSL